MRTTAIVTSVLLSAALVAGCGGDDGDKKADKGSDKGSDKTSSSTGDYCKDLKAAKADFDTFESDTPDFTKLDDAIETFHELADSAPSEVSDDWTKIDGALTAMETALEDAGLKMEDIGAITAGELPEGMTLEEVQALGPKLQTAFSALDADDVEKAGDEIEKHAKSECGVDLAD